MRRLGSVQQKIPCVFLTDVMEEQSRKRDCQVNASADTLSGAVGLLWVSPAATVVSTEKHPS